jgi:hypothetical protein
LEPGFEHGAHSSVVLAEGNEGMRDQRGGPSVTTGAVVTDNFLSPLRADKQQTGVPVLFCAMQQFLTPPDG